MAGELKHASVGTSITQAEFEAVSTHTLDGITNGDVLYADGTNIKRLAKGTDGDFLSSGTPPSWVTHATALTGIHGWLQVIKASDETVNNSAVLQNDDELVLALEANSTYVVRLEYVQNSGSTPDFKATFTVPSGATLAIFFAGGHDYHGWVVVSGTSAGNLGGQNAAMVCIASGVVKTGVTAGNLQFQWAQNTQTASDTKVLANSILMIKKVA